jgi:GR25 family glycosyltransferase involved in LPS biosynthesis
MKYYCIHHSPDIERKAYMDDLFMLKKIDDIVWIVDYLPDSDEVKSWENKVESTYAAKDNRLNVSEISCFLKHKKAIKHIAASGEIGVILEDDIAIPQFDMAYFVDGVLSHECTTDKMIFIGSFADKDIVDSAEYVVHFSHSHKSRCAHAYMLNAETATKITPLLEDIKMPFDWQLNSIIEQLNLCVGWTKPHIYQRTEKGIIKSLLR